MARNRPEFDPLEERKRELAEQARLLAEQQRRLTEELRNGGGAAKQKEHPVWRRDEDAPKRRVAEVVPARKRHLARQRQRDMVLFFVFIAILIALVIVGFLAYAHVLRAGPGAS